MVMKTAQRAEGFTLTELLMALAFFMILSATGTALFGSVTPSMRVNGQVNRVLSLMQNGRENAITKQRNHLIRFDEVGHRVELFRLEDGDEIPVETVAFEYGVQLFKFEGAVDTPDGYGGDSAVDFGEAAALMFNSEGSLVDESEIPTNGTIFLQIPNSGLTARAITITGSTGRARFYVWNGNAEWEGGWLAK